MTVISPLQQEGVSCDPTRGPQTIIGFLMHILLLGSGGREHALAWKIAASPLVTKLWCAPGNAGIAASLAGAVCGGFGRSRQASQLEGSKGFTKALCTEFNIPTGAYGRFTKAADALAYVRGPGAPIVVKAGGRGAGQGVIVRMTMAEAEAAIAMMFDGGFGGAGAEVVIEEFLEGREISFFALCDGDTAIPLASAQDHKRVFDHDQGPNTGGMGAYSPTPFVTPEIHDQIMARIILPTVNGMKARGTPFRGVLYAGVMLTADGPKLFEYNVRFGDPECQVLMLRMMSDIVPAFLACCDGQLKNFALRWFPDSALTVVMAAKGYPGDYARGTRIEGLDDAAKVEGAEIFHAGTIAKDGQIFANGGRVLNVCATGKTIAEAQRRAYEAVDRIKWPEGFCRRDIGWQAVEREKGGRGNDAARGTCPVGRRGPVPRMHITS